MTCELTNKSTNKAEAGEKNNRHITMVRGYWLYKFERMKVIFFLYSIRGFST